MNKQFARVRISDIARQAGVSTGTVDRVIHNRGEVSAETRSRVMRILEELNYEPDIFASALALKRVLKFTAIIPESSEVNKFWAIPNEGLDQAINEIKTFGVSLEKRFYPYHNKEAYIRQLEDVISNKPDGVILTPIFVDATHFYLRKFDELKIPVVFLNTQIDNFQNLAFVGQDSYRSGMVAANMFDFGLGRDVEIFIVNIFREKGGNVHILKREQGFRDFFMKKYGECCKNVFTINVNCQDSTEVDNILKQNLKIGDSGSLTRGVFVTNSRVFIVADFIFRMNIKNVRLIGYDLLDINVKFLKEGTIDFLISQNPFEQGYRSLMTLFNKLFMKKEVVKDQYLPIDIITKENIDYYLK